jgi:nucleotide-binding universal stress UspA family protein
MPHAITHLLVPTDFRPASRAAARLALEMAYGAQARVTFLHVIPEEPLEGLNAIGYLHRALWTLDGPRGYNPLLPNGTADERKVREQLEREVHPEWRHALTIKTAVRTGDVAAEVTRFAHDEAADMILVGVNRPGWRLAWRTRRSDRIVRLAGRQVVLVHSARKARRTVPVAQLQPA